MSLDAELEELLTETITVEPFLPTPLTDGSTQWDAANPRTFRGRVEQFARMVRNREGREVVSSSQIFLAPTPATGAAHVPTANDRFTLPAGYYPQQPPAISVQRENDQHGLHHWVVYL
jgi:hypothetical protein